MMTAFLRYNTTEDNIYGALLSGQRATFLEVNISGEVSDACYDLGPRRNWSARGAESSRLGDR